MGLMIESNARFVGRDEIAQVPTPIGTISWKPVPHMEVIDAVGDVVNARGWRILDEQYLGAGWTEALRSYADQPQQFARMEPLHRHPQQP